MENYKNIEEIEGPKNHNQLMTENFTAEKYLKLKKDVSRLVYDIAFRKKSFYRELFASHANEINKDNFKLKIIFKLKRIIDTKFKDIKAKIYPTLNGPLKTTKNSYLLPLKFVIIDEQGIQINGKQTFFWFNYPQDENQGKMKDIQKEAEAFLLTINKAMFYDLENNKGQDLFDYIQGKLQTISLDFSIKPHGQNMYLKLKDIDFQIHVYLKGEGFCDVTITESESGIRYYGKGENKISKNQKISSKDIISKSQIDSYGHMVMAKMQRELSNVGNADDTVGEVVKVAQFILYKLFGAQVAQQIVITTNQENNKKLREFIDGDTKTQNSNGNLDLKGIIISYNTKLEYDNVKMKVVDLEYVDPQYKIIDTVSEINLKNKFLEPSHNLFWLIAQELNGISYNLILKNKGENLYLKTADIHLFIHVYGNGPGLMDIELYLKEYGRNGLFKYHDKDKTVKIRDEL